MGCAGCKNYIFVPGDGIDAHGIRTNKQGRPIYQYDRSESRPENNEMIARMFEIEFVGAAEQVLAVKPWIGALKPPSIIPPMQNSAPSIDLHLEYVYGYRVFDSRKNLFYTSSSNTIVYMVAALGVVLNTVENRQRYFGAGLVTQANGHSDDITALAMHSNRDLIATAEVGQNPKIHTWSALSPESPPLNTFSIGRGHRGISSLSFSHDGIYLAAADLHNNHYITIFNLSTNTQVIQKETGPDKILDLSWSPTQEKFISAGIKHISFWKLTLSFKAKQKKGIFAGAGEQSNMTSAAWISEDVPITGAANGQIYLWKKRALQRSVQVHEYGNAIHCLVVINDRVFSGGKDQKVVELTSSLEKTKEYLFESYPRSIDMRNDFILVGTRNGKIIEVHPDGKKVEIMDSHYDGEVWGMAIDKDGQVVTSADDNQIKTWNPILRKCVATGTIDKIKGPERKPGFGASTMALTGTNQQARSVAINTQNNHVALGHNNGHITIRSSSINLNTVIMTLTNPQEWTEVLHYSPDNSKLAAGSHDNYIYIYNVYTGYQLEHRLVGHHSFITALDWSVDGSLIHSTSGDYEILFWDVKTGTQVTDGASRYADEVWHQWTCPLGWPVRGIFGTVIDYTHVNRVHRAPGCKVVAVGNDWGLVEVFAYPNAEGAKSLAYRGHSEHVMNVKWSQDGGYLFSAGGFDQTVMQWKRTI